MIGQTLHNRYTVTARLGKGAMGTVYRATDSQTGQEVAVKVIARELAFNVDMLERFKREGQALHQLRHPNIVGFVDAFQHDEQYVIIMEYVPGGSLHDLIKQGKLPVERARRIALELCDALTRAHHLNIIHRDLKPENILIAEDGTPKLTDFGVAKLVEGSRLTGTGTQVGTPYYMSPEAWEGKSLDAQADIWSLGIVFYEMLSGEVPFGGDTLIAVMNKVLTAPLPDIKKKRPDVPEGLARIVRRMLIRKKTDRYHTVREAALDLERAQPGVQTPPVPGPVKIPSWVGIAAGVVTIGACAVALVIGGIWAAGALQRLGSAASGQENASPTPPANVSEGETAAPANTPKPATAVPVVSGEPVTIRWFVGLGTGTSPEQVAIEEEVVADFNASQDAINLVLEVVPYDNARDMLSTYIASGEAPDIVGPVGIGGAEQSYHGEWLDLAPLIDTTGYDLTQYPVRAVQQYTIEGQGQIAIPFLLFPSALYYQRSMFDAAGLNYPPHKYGDPYVWPNGTTAGWTFETLRKLAIELTLDSSGRNPIDPQFNPNAIVQYGYEPQWQTLAEVGSFYSPGSFLAADGQTVQVPSRWEDAWQWLYEGVWEDHFIASQSVIESAEFGSSNVFNSGKAAMALSHNWYTCCIGDAGNNWDLAVVPTHFGQVTAPMHSDTFFIHKATQHPAEAFEVLTYLINQGASDLRAVYGSYSIPAREADQNLFITTMTQQFPHGVDWQVALDSIAYSDVPSYEAYLPNAGEANNLAGEFLRKLRSTQNLDLEYEFSQFEQDLQTIFDK